MLEGGKRHSLDFEASVAALVSTAVGVINNLACLELPMTQQALSRSDQLVELLHVLARLLEWAVPIVCAAPLASTGDVLSVASARGVSLTTSSSAGSGAGSSNCGSAEEWEVRWAAAHTDELTDRPIRACACTYTDVCRPRQLWCISCASSLAISPLGTRPIARRFNGVRHERSCRSWLRYPFDTAPCRPSVRYVW